jgi:predicted AlkP superfamily pyrophosphatase or phosphodiesterase
MLISRRRFAPALAGLAASVPRRLRALPPRPRLFVFLVAEQFRRIYLERARRLAPGGFRRLMEDGVYYPDCRMAASSFTATGLATLATGAYPQLHGIVADKWFDRKTRGTVKASAELLEATTLADELARAGHGRAFCLGLDEASTSLLAGRSPAPVFWIDASGQFTVRGSAPEWLVEFNRQHPVENLHNAKWWAVGAGPELPPLRTLTWDPQRPKEFLALYLASRFSQDAQFELLRALLEAEKLGHGETLDFVFVSLGSLAMLGYETGSNSPLMDQLVLSLDRQIQATLEALHRSPGAGNYNLVFAAAHGAPPEPDPAQRAAKAISGESIAQAVNKGLSSWIDSGFSRNTYVDRYVYPFLYLNLDALRKVNVPPRGARRLAGEVALRQPGVAGYYTADGDCSHTGEWRRRFENSFHALRSGDVMLSYDPGDVEDFGPRGVSFGSLYSYDTSVPLFLYGAQFGARVIERAIQSTDLAPTIARAAGLAVPSSATGEALAESFAEERGGR